jgi:hypothetical protein
MTFPENSRSGLVLAEIDTGILIVAAQTLRLMLPGLPLRALNPARYEFAMSRPEDLL